MFTTPLWRCLAPRLYFFADEGAGGGAPSGGTAGGGTPPPPDAGSTEGGSKLPQTQEELDRVIQDRLNRATRGTVKPEELGFKTKAELDEAIKDWNDRKTADQTEQDRLVEEARKTARAEAENEIMGKANARLVKSEFVAKAQDKGVVAPQDLYLIAQAEGRFDDISITDSDEVEGLDDSWWEELLKDRPHLVAAGEQGGGTGGTPPTPGGNVNGGSSRSSGTPKGVTDERKAELAKKYPALVRR